MQLDRFVAAAFALVLVLGPWTQTLGRVFALLEFEKHGVGAMAAFLLVQIPRSLAYGAPYFLVPPIVALAVRYALPSVARTLHRLLTVGACVASVVSLPLLLLDLPAHPRDVHVNLMGNVLVVDATLMFLWHTSLCLDGGSLPPTSLAAGPLCGLGLHLSRQPPRTASVMTGFAALYCSIGALYAAFREAETMDMAVLARTLPLAEWYGYELYAMVTVVGGFLLICAGLPVPRTGAAAAETVLFIVLANGNVASAWIASRGMYRRPLETAW